MKLVILAGYYPPDIKGGGEISTQVLAEALNKAGCSVDVLTCGREESEWTRNGVRVKRIHSPNLYWDYNSHPSRFQKLRWHAKENFNPKAKLRIRETLNEIQPELLITSTIENFGGEGWVAAHEAGIPSVHIMRSYYPFCFRGNAVHRQQNCSRQCAHCNVLSIGRRHASQFTTGVIGVSRYILDRHLQSGFFTHAATAVIGEPISQDLLRRKVITSPPVRFGYLGVLSEDKGLESLAMAWKQAQLSGCALFIAGRGKPDYVAKLRSMFPIDVEFKGWVDSSNYLMEVDYLIVPSIWNEPFGRVVIEAFAKGVPVLGSRIAGIAEIIRDHRNGFTFEPNNSQDLAGLLRRCAQMPLNSYRALSQDAYEDAHRYRSPSIIREHIEFYQDVVRHAKILPLPMASMDHFDRTTEEAR
jgi:glycosyltransferase involved in cell wall biosynthesis